MKIKAKETDVTEVVTDEDFELCNTELFDGQDCRGECLPTPIEQGFSRWKERKKIERMSGNNNCNEVNLTEELVYSCLPDGYIHCLQV